MTAAPTPTLVEGSVTLTPFSERHLTPRYVGWLSDPQVTRYSEQRHRAHSLDSCRAYWASMARGPHHFWAIEINGGHAGNLSAYVDAPNGVADVAIMIGEAAARGRGHGLAAWRLALAWLLDPRGGALRKATAGAMAANAPMLALMEASGMEREGGRRAQFLLGGAPVDLVMAAKFQP